MPCFEKNMTDFFEKNAERLKRGSDLMKKHKKDKHIQPVVCPAGQRDDIPRHLNLPCPDEQSLEEEYQWRREHIQ